ncbi:transcriptional regulator, TetR family [Rhizobiales bacterium GAS191]|jgi:AcrR family transcriptional regulator|nr:transcriptional regulator, TetR family [Rhizobiales bacterium GAS113]SED93434.1 transcriptional regulator, TetR family [Rhizobiales bacterium GAS191]SEE54022.1 transcriptional regulator, TetR family [Rhizobiales bacterium GAS188]
MTTVANRPRAKVHNRDRDAEILDAARTVFEERGFEAASIAGIARRAHVAEGTIYLYSATKRDLLLKVVRRWYEGLIAEIEEALAERVSVEAKLRYFAHRQFRVFAEDAAIGRLLVRELRTAPDYADTDLYQLNRRYTRLFTSAVRAGIETGEISSEVPSNLARDLFFGGIEHAGMGGMGGLGPARIAERAETFFALFWKAVAGDAVASEAPRRSGFAKRV